MRPRGSVRRLAKDKYRVRVCLGRDSASGRYRYHDETVFGKKSDADALVARVLADVRAGSYVAPSKLTLGEWFDEWLKVHKTKVMPRTAAWYQRIFDTHVRPVLGVRPLAKLRADQVESLYAALAARVGPVTIRAVHVGLNACLRKAVRRRLLMTNPVADLSVPKIERKERRTLSPAEAARVLEACDQVRNGVIVEFALLTGTRPEEYLALQWSDLDWQRRTVTLQRVAVEHDGKVTFEKMKTPQSRRSIPLPPQLVAKLQAHRKKQLEQKLKAGRRWNPADLVFPSLAGTVMRQTNLTERVFKRVLERAEVEHLRLYDLRHTQATLLLQANEHPKVVQERLGHSSIVLTMDTYSHVLPTMQEAATSRLAELLYPASQTPNQ